MLGLGNAFAFAQLFLAHRTNPITYRPTPKLREGRLIRQYGSACIDTSDGFFPALANLTVINEMGFRLCNNWDSAVRSELWHFGQIEGIPSWYLLAGPHGEYELLFTIPAVQEKAFLAEAESIDWRPVFLGEVIAERTCYYPVGEQLHHFDPVEISNLFELSQGQPNRYLNNLKKYPMP